MKYKPESIVSVKAVGFEKLFSRNEWVIDHIKTGRKGKPSLYVCYNISDKYKTLYQFTENEIEKQAS